jgi:zinc protease
LALGVFAAPVSESVLPNGLRVLIKESHAAPVVVIDVWYKVGSRNEGPGFTGASHLLEHMTYKGTREFAKDDMRNLTKRNGAIDNGATFYDYTHYYTTIASDRLPLVLRMEASRMSAALIKQSDLDSERTVVRSELEGHENDPGTLLFQQTMAAVYRVHAYRWPVVGWRADIEHITAEQLRGYYHSYYQPNNATLVIVGDVKTAQALQQVRQYFGGLKRELPPPQWTTPEPPQFGERRVTVHRQGKLPMEFIAWHIPAIHHKDIPALTLLDQILGSGRLSRLYQQIVETQQGISAWSGTMVRRDSGIFYAGGVAAPGQTLAPIEKTIFAEVDRLKTTPPNNEEIARALRQMQASLIYGRDSVTDQADQLGEAQTVAGDWRYPDQLLDKMRTVTPEDISRVARTYLTEDNRTVGIFQPVTASGVTKTAPAPAPAQYGSDIRPRAEFATTPAPAVGTAVAQPVHRTRIVLPNGIVLLVQENHANTTVAISANLKAGRAYDPAGKTGAADMVANLLDRGTSTRSSREIAQELEGAAAEITSNTGWETVGIHGKALSGDSELLLRNIADQLRHASFPTDEIEKMRAQMLSGLENERDDPSNNARRAFYRAVLPAGHPYRLASFDEEADGLKALTRADLTAFYQARYTPKSLVLAVVGDVQVDAIRALVTKYFGDWQGDAPTPLVFPALPLTKPARLVTTIPDKSEVDIYVGSTAPLHRTSPDYYAAEIMNFVFGGGGALNSRLGNVIRDQHGLAYTVYSDFHASTGAGPWFAMLGVNPVNVDTATKLLREEVTRMRDSGVTQQEIDDAVAYLTGAYAITLQTNDALASTLMDAEYFHLGLNYPERVTKLYRAVTRAQVNAAAKKYLHPDALIESIAGSYPRPK